MYSALLHKQLPDRAQSNAATVQQVTYSCKVYMISFQTLSEDHFWR